MTEPRRDFDAEMAYSGRMFGWSMGLLLLASVLFNIPPIFILGLPALIAGGICGYLSGAEHKIYLNEGVSYPGVQNSMLGPLGAQAGRDAHPPL